MIVSKSKGLSMNKDINYKDSTILVVDDSKFFLKTISSFLGEQGFNVVSVDNAKDALKQMRAIKIDVILCDYEMPDMNGPELCNYLKADVTLKQLPVIMLTAREDHHAFMIAIQSGADDFISKTSFEEVLIPKIICMLRLKSIRSELLNLKEIEAVKTVLATFKHEFNNRLMIMSGNLMKMKATESNPGHNDEAFKKIEDGIQFIAETLEKISQVEFLEKEDYDSREKIYRVK